MASIELKNIEKSFGTNKVINKFDIKINDGEFVVLVGPSGCGKSTLLRMISGLESVDIGEIYLDNKLINNLIPSKREIAMVFQSYALYPHMNVFENMAFGLKMEKISKSEFFPSVTITGTKSEATTKKLTDRDGTDASITDVDTETQTVTIEQKVFQGLGGKADLEKSKIGVNLAKAKLLKKEQEVILSAAEAFTGVILANKKFKINKENLDLLERQVETDQNRLESGIITLADLAQSESSLAGAQAQFISSQISNFLDFF